jgi:hypothetical protein
VTKEEGKEIVGRLVESFESRKIHVMKPEYLETEVRTEFLDDFYAALGWDIKNHLRPGEVKLESGQTFLDDGKKGRADYEFKLGRGKSFFVEAKKPSENLETNPNHAIQARRYAFSAKHPVVILSDFEEFSVYLGRGVAPKGNDTANTAKLRSVSCRYTDYLDRWDQIWGYFSRESVLAGALETIPGVDTDIKGEKTVDDLFLSDIESWRKTLAVNIYKNNPYLLRRSLNEVVQKTIDRIIFLRICEDREIEDYGQVLKLKDQTEIYKALSELFKKADKRYNSGLFNFDKDKGDSVSLSLSIDNAPFQAMIERLYFPGGPYAFAVMPADILGQVYERFLGKVIEIGKDGVNVEDKPEVKKAGGVFYTPEYIVDYIVNNTVGPLVKGKKKEDVAKIKILDPACGSGAFLINAYQYLLDWHLTYYTTKKKPETWEKERRLIKDINGIWRLSLTERKRILTANIFGVDIDPQAVEVTRLSLLLKCLEGETKHTAQLGLFDAHERVLPDMDRNIKCGNSLIGTDFDLTEQMLLPVIEMEEALLKVNAFDWKGEFADVFRQGGFDVVIGNPPYVRQEALGEEFKKYAQANFKVYHGIADLYSYFFEQGLNLLKAAGMFSIIVANKWIRANYGIPLRKWLKVQCIQEIVDFGDLPVFQTATTYPCIIRIAKSVALETFKVTQVENLENLNLPEYVKAKHYNVRFKDLDDKGWSLIDEAEQRLLKKLLNTGQPLNQYVDNKIYYGIKTGLNEAFVIDRATRDQMVALCDGHQTLSSRKGH